MVMNRFSMNAGEIDFSPLCWWSPLPPFRATENKRNHTYFAKTSLQIDDLRQQSTRCLMKISFCYVPFNVFEEKQAK
jgi:hypothetical protein